MRAGILNRRITILQKDSPPVFDTYGADITPFVPLVTVWAHVQPGSGRELVENRKELGIHSYTIRLRYQGATAITNSHKVRLDDNRVLDIISASNSHSRDRELVLLCEEDLNV